MVEKGVSSRAYIDLDKSNFRRGLDLQRERFKLAKFRNDFDGMADSIENLKSEIKPKMIRENKSEIVKKIEKIMNWYRLKEVRYTTLTEDGYKLVYPPDMHYKVNKNLTIAYEMIIKQLELLDLL